MPPIIEEFGDKPRGIDAHPAHWHAVIYDALIHNAGRFAEFSIADCWRALAAADIPVTKFESARTTSLNNFLAALEAKGFLEPLPDRRWKVMKRYATREERRVREEERKRQAEEHREREVEEQRRREAETQAEKAAAFGVAAHGAAESIDPPPRQPAPPPASQPPLPPAAHRQARRGFLSRLFGR